VRRFAAIGCGLFALAALAGLVYISSTAQSAHTRFRQQLAGARAIGLAIAPADLRVFDPPPGTNAAPVWDDLAVLLQRRRLSPTDTVLLHPLHIKSLRPARDPNTAMVRATLNRRRDVVTLIDAALAKPHCVFHHDWALGPNLIFPLFARMRFAASLRCTEGRVLCAEGKPVEAAHRVGEALRIASHLDEEPAIIIGYLVGTATNQIALDGLADVLQRAGEEPGVAAAVTAEVGRNWRPRAIRPSLQSELVVDLVSIEYIRDRPQSLWVSPGQSVTSASGSSSPSIGRWRPPFWNAYVDANGAFVVSQMQDMVAAADLDYGKAALAYQAVCRRTDTASPYRLALAKAVLPNLSNLPAKAAEDRARAAVVTAAAAVFDWRVRHGVFPDQLVQAMPRVPPDPFDLKPLRYQREGAGFAVWSAGKSGRFDGGKAGANVPPDEVYFRYPDRARR
jgi:hypothetical protein